jgi:hypothetical protein
VIKTKGYNLVAVHNLSDWAVAFSRRFILLPEVFLEIYVRNFFKTTWSFSAVWQMTPQRFELL